MLRPSPFTELPQAVNTTFPPKPAGGFHVSSKVTTPSVAPSSSSDLGRLCVASGCPAASASSRTLLPRELPTTANVPGLSARMLKPARWPFVVEMVRVNVASAPAARVAGAVSETAGAVPNWWHWLQPSWLKLLLLIPTE